MAEDQVTRSGASGIAPGVFKIGARLTDLRPGRVVRGVKAGETVTVVAVARHGDQAVTLTFRDAAGKVDERLLYAADEPELAVAEASSAFTFDGDGELFRLVSEARRIKLAHLFDPMLAVHLSRLEPLPHQIQAVYGSMLPRQPLRFLLADDPGAGKTIMAGLYVKELMLRGDVARCLVVAPGGLVAQWQDELVEKFGLRFDIATRESVEASHTGNPFAERNLLIARLDHLARNDELQERLADTEWDLVVVDEAHRMSAHYFGTEVRETRRYRLGKLLGGVTRHLLLMTATPHAGKEDDFQLFMALLDADRFEGKTGRLSRTDTSDLMRRMVKEKLLRFDGRRLFSERRAYSVPYALSEPESELYDAVTSYVTSEMNRVDRLREAGQGRRGNRVGFALTVLQRRLASSSEAIYQSLSRRRKRLESELATHRVGAATARGSRVVDDLDADDEPDSYDELSDAEREAVENELAASASAAQTIAELENEIATLTRLETTARHARDRGTDRKWVEFSMLLDDAPEMRDADGARRKLIVFTEHRDTLNYLVDRLRTRLGRADAVVTIHGGTSRDDRRRIQEVFRHDRDCLVLVATDAAGEGINLQRAHLLVNYDLPWNPNRIEQRFGRVHRIGQTEVCHMWNLVAVDTREGQVYQRLLAKLDEQRAALGGQVFDVLGEALSGQGLRDLLLRAVRYGDRPEVRAQLDEVIDARVGVGLAELVAAQALASDVLGMADVERVRLQMEEAAARRLQPHFVRAFFLAALTQLGGRAAERESERYEVAHVPAEVRAAGRSGGVPVLNRYQRVCFDKEFLDVPGKPKAELLAPGHPLLDAVLAVIEQRYGGLLRQGAVLVDVAEAGDEPQALMYLEHAIADGREDRAGQRRVVSRRFEYVELAESGAARTAGAAPYLDLRPASDEELRLVRPLLSARWLASDVERRAMDTAIGQAVPAHLTEVRERTVERVRRVRSAVRARLTREINHWDQRANELREQGAAGRQPRMNPDRAQARADELSARLSARMAELEREEQLHPLPPVVVGAALVVPTGLLDLLRGRSTTDLAADSTITDARAMQAVLAAEMACGRQPERMPHANPGYDIRSRTADGHYLFVEVKGRVAGGEHVHVSKNQILHGLNAADRFVLALVSVSADGPEHDEVRYLRNPFRGMILHFAETGSTFDWAQLWQVAAVPS